MTCSPLTAIRFETEDIDGFLLAVAHSLKACGLTVRGVFQSRGAASGDCHCADMDLTTLGSDRVFRISQPLGTGSRGCRMNPGALANCAAFLERELEDGADLLILNRFGRGESEGRGFRDLIAHALTLGVPVLTAVKPPYFDAWQAFSEGEAQSVPMSREAVFKWLTDVKGNGDGL